MNNDFEHILQRLREGLQGEVSSMEGTFAGDILQAVAAELARIWSQEIDTVTQRGFIATAEGQWLDYAAGDYGVVRKANESDGQLRRRVLAYIRQRGASGNAADYNAWALAVDGVAAAETVPLGRGAGTVDVYFVPESGASGVQERLEASLAEKHPVGADVQVKEARAVAVTVKAQAELQGGRPLSAVQQEAETALRALLEDSRLTERGRTVSLNRVIGALIACEGVGDVSGVTLNGKAANLKLGQGAYAVLSSLVLEESSNV